MDLYHAVNRGVEKRNIFLDSQDYARFVHNLYAFNDKDPVVNFGRSFSTTASMSDLGGHSFDTRGPEQLVKIHAWCLMRNHFHLLLSERQENGISKFLMKVNVGYAKYFNEKYQRNGYVFQGRTKRILIEREQQFNYILHYIHLNPLDYCKGAENWRIRTKGENKQNLQKIFNYLRGYRWRSYRDYIGEKNFPSLLDTGLITKEYSKEIEHYLRATPANDVGALVLE